MSVRRLQLVVLAVCCLLPAAPSIYGQTTVPAQIVQPINNSLRVTLSGSVHPLIRQATDLGALSPDAPLSRMLLVLKPGSAPQAALRTLLENQQSKSSPLYHKWLTPAEFSAQFGPAPADVQKIASWLQEQGFTDLKPAIGGQWIEFTGKANTVQAAFQTSMHRYQIHAATGVEQHIANASDVSIPQAIAPAVQGILSLNNFNSKPLHTNFGKAVRNVDGKLARVKGDATATDGNGNFQYYLAPGDIRKIYGATSLPADVDGKGTSIAIIGRSDVQLTDIQTFRTIFSLPANDPNFIVSGPDPGMDSWGDAGESTLDIEWAGALAPKATINFVTAGNTDTTDGVALAALYAVENVVSPIISLSYGSCEKHMGPSENMFWSSLWQQAAAEGVSVFVSSGDAGAGTCDGDTQNSGPAVEGDSVNGLASTPFNVAVGGTQFAEGALAMEYWDANSNSDLSSAIGYIPEAIWNESCDPNLPATNGNCDLGQAYYMSVGGGGGRSSCSDGTMDVNGNVTCTAGYAKPSWQKGAGVPADGVRDVPDVSLNASPVDDPYIFCFLASCQFTQASGGISVSSVGLVGGTSVSSPVMASIMALVEQQNGTYQGLPNYVLYNLAAQDNSSCSSAGRVDPTQAATCIFNDVTVGNNGVPGLPGYGTDSADYTATAGYDLASGLGSVNIANLVSGWKSASATVATTTKLTAGITTAKHGTALPLQAAVTSAAGTPAGDIVLLTDKYSAGDQFTLATDGTWSGQVKDLPGGSYNLSARYGGNNTYSRSVSAGTALTITPEDSSTVLAVDVVAPDGTLTPDTDTHYLGYQLYFKGAVAGLSGHGVATGTVSVLVDGKTNVGTGKLTADGGILLSAQDVPVGSHSITLQYGGDNSFNASTSAPVPVTVGKGQSATYVSIYGGYDAVISALVSVSGKTQPTGTLQIYDNQVAIGPALPIVYTGPMGEGDAQVVTSHAFTPGPHTLVAVYSGDANYDGVALGSDSALPRSVTIPPANNGAATTTSFTMTSASVLKMGQVLTFVATVTAKTPHGQLPTGTVFLYANNDIVGSGTLVDGKATGISYMDGAGDFLLRAEYRGDSNFASSFSANTAHVSVPKLTPAFSFNASADYALPNTQTSLNFRVSGQMINTWVEQDPNGTVTFTDSVNGGASIPLGTYNLNFIGGMQGGYSGRFVLPTGSNALTAIYSGNPNFIAVSSTVTVVVSAPDFTVTGGPASLQIAAGTSGSFPLNLTPVLGFAGNVVLSCANGLPAGATCTINPSTLPLSSGTVTTVTLSTLAPSPTPVASSLGHKLWVVSGGTSLAGLLLLMAPRRRRAQLFVTMAAITLSLGVGCGSSQRPKATLLSLASSNTKVASGSSITFTATLDALDSRAGGTVTFYDGSTAVASNVALTQGVAEFPTNSLSVGGHIIKAVYGGDNRDQSSTSSTVTQVITGNDTLQVTATSGGLSHSVNLPVTLN